jgi:hypothetical protein
MLDVISAEMLIRCTFFSACTRPQALFYQARRSILGFKKLTKAVLFYLNAKTRAKNREFF